MLPTNVEMNELALVFEQNPSITVRCIEMVVIHVPLSSTVQPQRQPQRHTHSVGSLSAPANSGKCC